MKGQAKINWPMTSTDVRILNDFMDDVYIGVEDENIRKVEDNRGISVTKIRRHDLGEQTIETTETTIRHNLGVTPEFVLITPRNGVIIYESRLPDPSRVYLQAVSSQGTAHVVVFG